MKIGGLLRFSMSDYPGRPAAVVFTRGCDFRCPFCHNGSLLSARPAPDDLTAGEVLRFLRRRTEQLGGVVISGGEPCLQPDLAAFLGEVRAMGFPVKLDTNGHHPEVLVDLIDRRLVDCIAMDIKAPLAKYPLLCGRPVDTGRIARSIALIAASGIDHLFRTTCVDALLDRADLAAIRALVPAGSRHLLQPFRAETAMDPALRRRQGRAVQAGMCH